MGWRKQKKCKKKEFFKQDKLIWNLVVIIIRTRWRAENFNVSWIGQEVVVGPLVTCYVVVGYLELTVTLVGYDVVISFIVVSDAVLDGY